MPSASSASPFDPYLFNCEPLDDAGDLLTNKLYSYILQTLRQETQDKQRSLRDRDESVQRLTRQLAVSGCYKCYEFIEKVPCNIFNCLHMFT